MRRLRALLLRFAGLFDRGRRERELTDEIESHLEMHTADAVRRGLTPDAARREAMLRLGGAEALKERYRDRRGLPIVDHLGQDLRYAGRSLRRSPGFTCVAVLTIAVGVAGPTVIFSLLKSWILEPLPFAQPDALVDIRSLDKAAGFAGSLNAADFLDFRRSATSFADLAGYRGTDVRLTGGARAERLPSAFATPNFFAMLGVHAEMGRVFDAADDQPGRTRIAVVSHAMWREHLAADPGAVGRTIRLDGEDHIVVGVLPDAFQFTLMGAVSVWRPLVFTPREAASRAPRSVRGLGRLREGYSVAQARDELTRMAAELGTAHPETNARRSVRVLGLGEEIREHHDGGFVVPVLFAMVGCVLLVACVNVTNVMLARTSGRRQEIAVRLALGASRARIVRQWLVEHVLLFVCASAVGAGLAVYGTAWLADMIPADNRQYLRNYGHLSVDGGVLLFALGVGLLSGVVFGWLPAWSGSRTDPNTDLRDASTRTATSRAAGRLRASLVVCEVALALGLLISAGLLVQTSRNVVRTDVGFDPRQLLTFQIGLDPQRYADDGAIRGLVERLIADLQARPGVASVAAGSLVPFGDIGDSGELFIEGQPEPPASETPLAALNEVTPDYGTTMRLRLHRGRMLNASDGPESQKVALVSETLASRYFSGREPIGQRIRVGRQSRDVWTVVGVVATVKNYGMTGSPEPQVYVPFAQRPNRRVIVVIRAEGDPESLAGTARAAVAALDPAEPVYRLFTMQTLVRTVTGPYESISSFVALFGGVTLLLAGVGVYGVVAYTFAQRTREIGIRMALGARRADVAALVLKQVRLFMLAGIVPGLFLAWTIGSTLRTVLVGVTPTDWRLYLLMSALLSGVAVIAALVPVRRATAIDPVTALRHE